MNASSTLKQEKIEELTQLIVQAAHPLRIILFGSAARGHMGINSDLDILVVMPDGAHRRRTAGSLYRALSGFGYPKDIVVVTEDDVRRFGNEPSLVICPALKEGKELYRAS
jgi:predicted nucleotidyltransferase